MPTSRSRATWLAMAAALPALLIPTPVLAEVDPVVGPPHVTIVSSLPLTWLPQLAVPYANAVQMAIDDAGGRVLGIRIDYRSLDDGTPTGGWPDEEANAAQAAADPSVVAYLGPVNSSAAMHSIPILCTAGLAMVSASTTRDSLTKPALINLPGEPGIYYPGCARNFGRTITRDGADGEIAAAHAAALGSRRAFVIGSNPHDYNAYGFATSGPGFGLDIVGSALGNSDVPPYSNLAAAIAASGADTVFATCFFPTPCPDIVRSLRQALPGVRFLITDGGLAAFPATAADNGLIDVREFVSPASYPAAAAAWYARYSARYGAIPGDDFNATIYAYDSTRVVLAAIAKSRAHVTRSNVRQAIMSTAGFPGLLGSFSFDPDGDTTLSEVSVANVIDGGWVETGTLSLP